MSHKRTSVWLAEAHLYKKISWFNIRPFILVDDVKVKDAGVLPNKISGINWNKDRGADVPSAPWYHLGLQYGGKEGDRINEHHLSLAQKKSAMEAYKWQKNGKR